MRSERKSSIEARASYTTLEKTRAPPVKVRPHPQTSDEDWPSDSLAEDNYMTCNSTNRPERDTVSADDADRGAAASRTLSTQSAHLSFDPVTGEVREEPSLRDELTAVDGGASAEAHPLFNIETEEVARLNLLKRGAVHVAQSLALSDDLHQAETGAEMFTCADRLRATNRGYRAVRRCKSRVCSHCAHIASVKATAKLRAGLAVLRSHGWHMRDESSKGIPLDRQMVALKITVNSGEVCELNDIRARVELLHDLFPRLGTLKAYKDEVIGMMRSTEVTESIDATGTPRAHPHAHGFILLRASADVDAVKRRIMSYWPQALDRRYDKLGMKVDTKASIRWAWLQLLSQQTSSDLTEWASYSTKGSYDLGKTDKQLAHQRTSPEYWSAVEREMKSVRLVSHTGELRDAISEAQREHNEEKSAARGGRVSSKPRPDDLVFNHLLRTYIRAEHVADEINPHAFTAGLSRLRSIPHFAALWRAEQVTLENRLIDAKKAALWRALSLRSFHAQVTPVEINREKFLIIAQERQERPREPEEVKHREPPQRGAPDDPRRSGKDDEPC